MKWLRYILIGVLAILAGLGLWWAISSGISASQSKQVVKDSQALQEGFEFFFEDQGRYPSTDEFSDKNIMSAYMGGFPPQNFSSETCQNSFDYYNVFPQSYELRFCLSKSVKGFNRGWNKVTN